MFSYLYLVNPHVEMGVASALRCIALIFPMTSIPPDCQDLLFSHTTFSFLISTFNHRI